MRLQIALSLICVLFPKALTLKCYQYKPGLPGTCTTTQTDCPDQCTTGTIVVNTGGQQQEMSKKTCAVAAECVTGSVNLGVLKTSVNLKCCSTDLCNSQKVEALPQGSPNDNKCYTCVADDCTGTVSCEGDEDHCISTTVTAGDTKKMMKGCASRSLCTAGVSTLQAAGVTGSLSCCEGNLCNSAEGVKLSLLIMLVPLISSILFI
ncbi:phospholipase A2 inhibitor and Ly6/PLAUR domain-containing protein-like [Colossoma macropomum]|uniref:phospholipase A2 inhibitor and Ly6/PLAUR domain-containing protein-like n=1 Tax=Colossoma macropomum TaxID=42526 RepID=UPI0018650A0A|nr:phospholipase A2 inhibitor and Ly6/PLAUR domain-containing protein-like [Colossoma macropomum]